MNDFDPAESEIVHMLRAWMLDLHHMGRHLTNQMHHEVEQIGRLVVSSGGTLREGFSAARSIIHQPASVH